MNHLNNTKYDRFRKCELDSFSFSESILLNECLIKGNIYESIVTLGISASAMFSLPVSLTHTTIEDKGYNCIYEKMIKPEYSSTQLFVENQFSSNVICEKVNSLLREPQLKETDFAEAAADSENFKRMPPKKRINIKGRVKEIRIGKPSRI